MTALQFEELMEWAVKTKATFGENIEVALPREVCREILSLRDYAGQGVVQFGTDPMEWLLCGLKIKPL